MDEHTLLVSRTLGVDHERVSLVDWHQPVMAGGHYAGTAVHEKQMVKIVGLTQEEHRRFQKILQVTPGLKVSVFCGG